KLAELCGGSSTSPNVRQCGIEQGAVFEAQQEILAAAERANLAAAGIARVYNEIEVEQNRAGAEAKIHTAEAYLLRQDGTQLRALRNRETDINRVQIVANTLTSIGTSIASAAANATTNPAATATSAVSAVMTAINGAVSFHLQSEIEEIENSRQKIAETQQVRVQLNVASSIKINSEARIKSLLLEIPSLEINARLAAIDSIRAIARLRENVQAVMD